MTDEVKNIDNQIKELLNKKKQILAQGKEVVDGKKFAQGMFSFFNPVLWLKDIYSIFNLRKLVIYAIILGCVAIYFYVQGKGETPVRTNIDYKEELIINLNGEYLHKPKNSNDVYIKDSETDQILKQIKAKDLPLLKKKLSPIGVQLQPVFVGGVGIGDSSVEGEVGVGISFFRYWKMQLETFLTQCGIYLGTSYQLTENSGAGLAVGKGYSGDDRLILYYRFNL